MEMSSPCLDQGVGRLGVDIPGNSQDRVRQFGQTIDHENHQRLYHSGLDQHDPGHTYTGVLLHLAGSFEISIQTKSTSKPQWRHSLLKRLPR